MKAASIPVTFSGAAPYTLTTSYVASDDINLSFAKRLTIFPYYKGGSGSTANTVQYTVWVNPYNNTEDPSGTYWSQVGNYIDTSGAWAEEKAVFTITQGTAGVYQDGVPLDLSNVNGFRVRIKAKETVAAGAAGVLQIVIVKNDIL